ncbi:MAG: OB-fold nucleic acid binding domain-containing protein [Nitrososphaerales archaeon]
MKVVELKDGMRRVNVEGVVSSITEPRIVNLRTGGKARVAEAKFEDDSGFITLTLWDEMIDEVSEGLRVRIENGYVNSFRGELRLNVGKYGKLTALRE